MLENEKRKYPVYRASENGVGTHLCDAKMALFMTSDRRDEDIDKLCVYLKKTYRAICNKCEIKEGDVVLYGQERLRVISVNSHASELCLHLESTQIIDTSSLQIPNGTGGNGNV